MSHKCEIAVISCIDFRFWKRLHDYLKGEGIEHFDYVALAGGAKSLLEDDSREVVFKQLGITVGMHKSEEVFLVNHIDCGAYGGSGAFKTIEEEREKLIVDLKSARDILREKYPDIRVKLLLMTLEGVEKIG